MPSRSSRNHARKSAPIRRNDDDNDARDTPQQQRASPPITFTPPTQLPTPLPEEHIPIPQRPAGAAPPAGLLNFADAADDSNAHLTHLIDFDTPTPPPALLSFTHADLSYTQSGGEISSSVLSEDDGPRSSTVYRSPPYREARLPDDSPPPLPVPARYQHEHILNDDGDDGSGFAGHTRAPTFVGCVSHFVRTSFFWGSCYVRLGYSWTRCPLCPGYIPNVLC
ncbi:hypothetical protein BJ912DRAFT_1002374 [Pholiota molesta]|nr:hypothetical protein BJ912DRAFT_1002374 [Pholiota molesta]